MEINKIQKAREIFLKEYPHPRIRRTVDANNGLTPIQRQILVQTDLMKVKYLNLKNA
jgi:hypothetical protein